jgi:hypothetical protein
MIHSNVWKFEKIWLSSTLIIIRKPKVWWTDGHEDPYIPPSSLDNGYDPLYSSSPLASLDRFSRSHGDGLYVMQLVVAATNQNALYKKHMFCGKNVNKIKMRVHIK